MVTLKRIILAAFLSIACVQGAAANEQLIHFVCETASEVRPVIVLFENGELVYGITQLPGSCKWTSIMFPEFRKRIGYVGKLVDSVKLDNGDRVWIGEVSMPNGKVYYSAGYYDFVS